MTTRYSREYNVHDVADTVTRMLLDKKLGINKIEIKEYRAGKGKENYFWLVLGHVSPSLRVKGLPDIRR